MSNANDDDTVRAILLALREENPSLGVSKLHALLKSRYSEIQISEKRARKLLSTKVFPSYGINPLLDVGTISPKIQVRDFGAAKGKGLVASQELKIGDVLWTEQPFAVYPEKEIRDLQIKGHGCGFCTTLLSGDTLSKTLPCTSSCPIRFCNRLCLKRAQEIGGHSFLCSSQNPASIQLIAFVDKEQWSALGALTLTTARLLIRHQESPDQFDPDWATVKNLATLDMERRATDLGQQPNHELWKMAFSLYRSAFAYPTQDDHKKRLAKICRKPIPEKLANELFEYPNFLKRLGSMSLNLEAHGGLYPLHSHLNHSCRPNISIRHLDQRSSLAKITVIAVRPIAAHEELCITYVNPEWPVTLRREKLLEWGFGQCSCGRCREEEKIKDDAKEGKGKINNVESDLAQELKAGLGVL